MDNVILEWSLIGVLQCKYHEWMDAKLTLTSQLDMETIKDNEDQRSKRS